MDNYLIAAMILFSVNSQASGLPAPLGLEWGLSESQVINKYDGVPSGSEGRLRFYEIHKPPQPLPGFESTVGVVDSVYGLVKVETYKTISDDAFGDSGKKDYFRFKSILQNKYGNADSIEVIGNHIYTKSDEFYQCLSYSGCGAFISTFSPRGGGMAGLSLGGKGVGNRGRGNGWIRLSYESPNFANAKDESAKENDKKASDAL
ncbi:hypothetical protein [Salmonella enterica]|uniref:hypothetical protein n=1 Tax=Salmonella enterica TaxID=28901 RepID=UPI0026DB882D|nr:hypothetical protein [Salmonella enterica]MDO3922639.1 hypothetical protein [Salmonella enterica]